MLDMLSTTLGLHPSPVPLPHVPIPFYMPSRSTNASFPSIISLTNLSNTPLWSADVDNVYLSSCGLEPWYRRDCQLQVTCLLLSVFLSIMAQTILFPICKDYGEVKVKTRIRIFITGYLWKISSVLWLTNISNFSIIFVFEDCIFIHMHISIWVSGCHMRSPQRPEKGI